MISNMTIESISRGLLDGQISLWDENMRFWQIQLNNMYQNEINRFKIIPVI